MERALNKLKIIFPFFFLFKSFLSFDLEFHINMNLNYLNVRTSKRPHVPMNFNACCCYFYLFIFFLFCLLLLILLLINFTIWSMRTIKIESKQTMFILVSFVSWFHVQTETRLSSKSRKIDSGTNIVMEYTNTYTHTLAPRKSIN